MAADSDEILTRLRGISSDEKSEMGKMKCRIDDQARLIMMLKKRNDEYILSNMALDKHSIQLERQIEELNEQLEEKETMKNQIEQLRQTIEQLKTSNLQWEFKEQQSQQKSAFHNQQYENVQKDILHFKEQIKTLGNLLKESNQNCERIQNDSNQKLSQREKIIDNQTIQLNQIREQLRNKEQEIEEKHQNLQQIEQRHLDHFNQLEQNKQLLEQQAKKLQKRLNEYSNEEEKLRQQLAKAQQILNEANQRFINEEERVNSDARVKQLQSQFIESQQKIERLEQEFIAYKNYTASLLSKEKNLNERLQGLLSGRTT